MCKGGGGAPQDIKNVIGLRIDEKVGNYCNTPLRVDIIQRGCETAVDNMLKMFFNYS